MTEPDHSQTPKRSFPH